MKELIEKNYKKLIIIICVLGILFRAVYVIKNPIRKNQYDCKIWQLYDLEDYEQAYKLNEENIGKAGHMYYIMTIYHTFTLPEGTGGQYYHPPLHHFISAVWLRMMDILPINAMQKLESLQILSFIYSLLTVYFIYKSIEKTNMKEVGKCLTMMLVNFFPLFIYMSGFINNDTLITLLTVISVYTLITWNEKQNIKNTLLFALVFGLGMMTKTSMAVMILPAMYVFLKKIVETCMQKQANQKIRKLLIQMLVFILVAGSLSLWFQIRKYVKYDSEMLGIQKPYDYFYSGDVSFLERWGVISKDILKNQIIIEDKNIFSYVINSALYCLSLFSNVASYIVKEITVILGAISLIAIVKKIIDIRKNNENINILLVIFISWILGFITFNILLPYSCTMNARYIGILFMICMIMLGNHLDNCKNKAWIYFNYIMAFLLSIFSMYLLIII